ncbi:hypothetical protein [Sphingobacterium detergens]|nr:hypothetical protein [Sphingobacterium detergens]
MEEGIPEVVAADIGDKDGVLDRRNLIGGYTLKKKKLVVIDD